VSKHPSRRKLNVYANLAHKHRTKKDAAARKKAEYLATLPKHPIKRLFHRMHPRRVADFWFSKKGALTLAKIAAVGLLLLVLLVGGLFAYYRKDLDSIRPSKLAERVQTTVTKYYDRRGPAGGPDALLWADKGDGDYKLVVKSNEISKYMKDATVAIEDQDFYRHHGVSITGLTRAFINNASGGSTQGGSTLTQQLVKQVFFADEAQERGLKGIPRKIKELILSIEVERMYNKEQILTLYLNESPYGGRRNGVESAAQTYFGKDVHAKNLNLAQSSLLAAIPNQPGLYNPDNIVGHEALIARQHRVLANMVSQGSITKKEAEEAKKVPILDTILPEAEQYKDIKAPHFVLSVRKQLESMLGKAALGRGGFTVTTTLDLRIQNKLEEAMKEEFESSRPRVNGYTNAAGTVEDVKTGQILAMMGSRDFNYPGYGQDNAAEAFIQPGSSVKPLVFAELMKNRGDKTQNFGSGTILKDEPIDQIYGAKLQNADKSFKGNLTIRQGLAQSRNIPAVKAMAIAEVQPTLKTIRALGDRQYCTQGDEVNVGLSSAIGGCGTRQVDHVNAFASLARMGVYKPHTSIIDVKNNQGKKLQLKKDKDDGKQIADPQVAYILSDILNDANARRPLFGSITTGFSYGNTGIKTATKTGTSDIGGKARDLWVMTYSPEIAMGVWLGNSDTKPLAGGNSTLPGYIVDKVMRYAHTEIYAKEGKWKANDWFTQPAGIQVMSQNGTKELYPSWYKKPVQSNQKQMFDKVSKKKATNCTPDSAKIEMDVTKMVDPVTKKDILLAPGGYDGSKDDDKHKCDDAKPTVSNISVTKLSGDNYRFTVSVSGGTHPLQQLDIKLNGAVISTTPITGSGDYSATYPVSGSSKQTVTATVTDAALYSGDTSREFDPL
jgi:membrane peptidoglycan carboxypeptidase